MRRGNCQQPRAEPADWDVRVNTGKAVSAFLSLLDVRVSFARGGLDV